MMPPKGARLSHSQHAWETRAEVTAEIIERGKKAGVEANVGGLNRKLIDLLGRLSYRTSYGQNNLYHQT